MSEELDFIKQRLDLLGKENEVLGKSMGLEFERISKAFAQMGNLLDLLYLEVSVLIEMLAKKNVGREIDVFADWMIFHDFSASLRSGIFYPGDAYPDIVDDNIKFWNLSFNYSF